jgi:ankyrin repeat protein/catechol 2,3-dioxygenase-like lactoylglutathione lyase family enzyme
MPKSSLPERPSLEYLKKLAKERLQKLRRLNPQAKLAAAQLAVARDHGFPSWRVLKAEIEKRQAGPIPQARSSETEDAGKASELFFAACTKGDVDVLRSLLAKDSSLARAADPKGDYSGWTGLHSAAQGGNLEAVRLLLEHGADPNAREAGDNTYPLHWAAANRQLEIVRALLDAGGEPLGIGDVHGLDVIGWATFYHTPAGAPGEKPEVARLLIERGARHHIFSAISVGDMDLIRQVVKQDPKTLNRRMSRFEGGQTALHFAMSLKRYDVLDLLIELGADLEAEDQSGHTALASAMMRGDREAISRLHAAGAKGNKGWDLPTDKPQARKTPLAGRTESKKVRAKPGQTASAAEFQASMTKQAESVAKTIPMLLVPDLARTLDWYTALGFKEVGRIPEQGQPDWGMVRFGKAEMMLVYGGKQAERQGQRDVRLWFYTPKVEELYQILKSRQIKAAQAALGGAPSQSDDQTIEFLADIHNPEYGGREFGIRDLNGYQLYFRWG